MLSHEAVEIIGEAGTGEEAIERAADAQPDLVLLDMKLPDLDGLVVLRRLREIAPAASVLIVRLRGKPAASDIADQRGPPARSWGRSG
jgi:DNA-binding NarL/FixJ family response regulator